MDKDYNFFNQYLNSQKKMMDMWSDYAKSFGTNEFNPFNGEYFSKINESFQNFNTADFFNFYGSPNEVIQKIKDTSKIYYNIYDLYKKIYDDNLEPTKENLEKVIKDFKENSLKYINNYLFPYIPNDMQNLIKQCFGASESFNHMIKTIYGPWMDNSVDLVDALMKGAFADPEGFREFFKMWKNNYEITTRRILNSPQFGIDRNSYERNLRTFDKLITFMGNYIELTITISNLISDSTENVIRESFELIKKKEAPKTYEEFYDYWKKTTSKEFDKLFYSDEFSQFLGNFVDSLMLLKIDMDQVLEESLKWMPIPTNSDMDSLYKTVYNLKKEVRELKRYIRDKEYEANQKDRK